MSGATEMQADTSTPPARPKVLSVIAENIPEELKRLRQWVVWRYELRDKWTKPPYRVIGTDRASSTDPETWGSFDDAVTTYQAGLADGVGFVVSSHDDFVGIDLDHCFDSDTGKSEPWAIDIIQKMQSYSEFSPSGEGIRIFVKGALPGGISGKKKGNVEIYSAGRYLTLTGHRLENARLTLETRQNEIDWLFEKFFRESEVKESKPASNGNGHTEWNPTDDELLTKAFMASNGGKIETLFNGDIAGYPSPSEADLALCSLLAFWAHDEAQLDRLFRRSDLMRDKWDEKHGAATYGEITVSKAWESSPEHYESRRGKADGSDAKHEDHDESETKESRDAAGKADRLTDAYPYSVEDGRIIRYQTVKENATISVPLCNFDAQIKEEVVLDDGAEPQRAFVIEGRLDTKAMLPETRVAVARFPAMNWVGESWGRRAIVNAGSSTKDHLRVAIQKLSPNARDRYVFTHTGWRKISGQWRYLSDSTTGNDDFEVDLGSELARYRLPSTVNDPVGAMKLSLSLLKVAPYRVSAPLFAASYRAPLCAAYPQDLSIWLEGRTGSMKSTLTAQYLNHFGDFTRVTLPGNWESTANQLERRAFLLKNNLFVIDEYVPTGLNRREIETKASRLLRGQGNLSGRNRLKSDLTERPAFYPQGDHRQHR